MEVEEVDTVVDTAEVDTVEDTAGVDTAEAVIMVSERHTPDTTRKEAGERKPSSGQHRGSSAAAAAVVHAPFPES